MLESAKEYLEKRAQFEWDKPEYYNFVGDTLKGWAQSQPEATALYWTHPDGREIVRNYNQLVEDAAHAAAVLKSAGVGRGDTVLAIMSREARWWEIVLACIQIGAIVSPGTVQLKPKDIAYRLEAANAKAIITNDNLVEIVDEGAAKLGWSGCKINVDGKKPDGWLSYEQMRSGVEPDFEIAKTRADEASLCYFTSGTTGQPKLTVHRHDYPLGHQLTGEFWIAAKPGDLIWNLSDTGWAKAAWTSLFAPWVVGAGVFALHSEAFDVDQTLDWLTKYNVTTLCAPPTVYRMFVRMNISNVKLKALKRCVSAGEPLNPEVIDLWNEQTGMKIYEGYGQTETVLLCGNFDGMESKTGSMGLPSPGVDLQVIGHDGNILAADQEGDIAVNILPEAKPLGMFDGYKNDEERTAAVYKHDKWYLTGDRAMRDADGYFWFVGRADDVILSSGYRIGPFEVESVLFEHEAVAESAVIASPDETRGEVVKAFIILAKGFEPSDDLKTELQQYVKESTAPYKYPRKIEFVETLPKTISGKIKRKELKTAEWEKA
ncbi:AMP-binding protein [Hirschia maritima]|uniref:AMP-binding protein n=1 Tax=Hirschia maritima TaxID=1121961 RepID=UPI00036FD7AA|nr:AMP-binding protein [Hirschia maritima]